MPDPSATPLGHSEDGPTLYEPLVDFACQQPRRLIEEHLVKSARTDAAAVSGLMLRAYTQGVSDGFQQGVQATIDRQASATDGQSYRGPACRCSEAYSTYADMSLPSNHLPGCPLRKDG